VCFLIAIVLSLCFVLLLFMFRIRFLLCMWFRGCFVGLLF